MATHSYSSLKAFETCARQYHEVRVLKKYPRQETEATLYGTSFHEAAEFYIKEDRPLPDHFKYAKTFLDNLKRLSGVFLCEEKLAMTSSLEPCDFFDPQCWFRGVADLIVLDEATKSARVVDYKTGKSAKYADPWQLELMALALFVRYPWLEVVKGGLLFVVANAFVKEVYRRESLDQYWSVLVGKMVLVDAAYSSGVWNPKKGGLCKKYCPVTTCEHNG